MWLFLRLRGLTIASSGIHGPIAKTRPLEHIGRLEKHRVGDRLVAGGARSGEAGTPDSYWLHLWPLFDRFEAEARVSVSYQAHENCPPNGLLYGEVSLLPGLLHPAMLCRCVAVLRAFIKLLDNFSSSVIALRLCVRITRNHSTPKRLEYCNLSSSASGDEYSSLAHRPFTNSVAHLLSGRFGGL